MIIYGCGHPRTEANTRKSEYGPRCATCRRKVEAKASAAYRERKKGLRK